MAGKSTYLETSVLNWLRGTAMPSAPTTVYVALFSSDPTDASTGGTEVTTTIRTAGRVAVAGATVFGTPSGSPLTIASVSDIDFGSAAGGASVSHIAIFDAATNGNKLYSGALSTARTFVAGDSVKIPTGSLTISET